MESNVIWDIVKIVLGGIFGIGLAAILPTIVTLRREREEKAHIKAETGSIFAGDLKTIASAAAETQEMMLKALEAAASRETASTAREDRFRQRIRDLEDSSEKTNDRLSKMEQQVLRVPILTEENEKLKARVKELEEMVKLLIKQVEELNHVPVVKLDK